MGIYIENMEMPKEIEPALVIDFCEDLDGKRYARFYHYRYGGLTDWHDVLEIPEPHGRLIDADALGSFPYNMDFCDGGEADEWIQNAPTVIQASEEVET